MCVVSVDIDIYPPPPLTRAPTAHLVSYVIRSMLCSDGAGRETPLAALDLTKSRVVGADDSRVRVPMAGACVCVACGVVVRVWWADGARDAAREGTCSRWKDRMESGSRSNYKLGVSRSRSTWRSVGHISSGRVGRVGRSSRSIVIAVVVVVVIKVTVVVTTTGSSDPK